MCNHAHLLSRHCKFDSKNAAWSQVKEVAPIIAGFWERAEFPHELVPKLAKLGLGGGTLSGHGCPGHSILEAAMVWSLQSRVSECCFVCIWNCAALGMALSFSSTMQPCTKMMVQNDGSLPNVHRSVS